MHYKEVVEKAQGRTVVIRTLDIGGDKIIPSIPMAQEANPFLGVRGIRLCLKQPALFRTQLRALVRASAFGNLCVMFPMITVLSELRAAKALIREVCAELAAEGIAYNANMPIGIMVEVPSVAVNADIFAPEVDFFSVLGQMI